MAVSLGMVIALIKKFGGGGGAVDDVQVNGTSVVSQGVADVPIASISNPGVVKIDATKGVTINANSQLTINPANLSMIKAGANTTMPITVSHEHEAVFYGFASAAGDSTQSSSNNSVGIYTENAKSAINSMLDAPETVSGTTPSITAKTGIRYICGEVSTLSIILPDAPGDIEVIFTSGSTPTVLTLASPTGLPPVRFPEWFDPSALEADRTYDIIITNSMYVLVTSWPGSIVPSAEEAT